MRKTVFWAACFAFALAVGGCDLLQKIMDTADGAGDTPEDKTDDTAVYVYFGGVYTGEETIMTGLVLSFSQTVAGLTADNITLIDEDGAGIQKGELSVLDDAAKNYALAVSGIKKAGLVTVKVAAPAGYTFSWLWGTVQAYVVYVQNSRFAA